MSYNVLVNNECTYFDDTIFEKLVCNIVWREVDEIPTKHNSNSCNIVT